MGKASRKKQSASQAGKPAGSKADKLTSPVRSESSHGGKPAGRETGLLSKPIIHLFIIVLLGFLAYSNTFHGPFQWDEMDYIVSNPIVKDMGFFAAPSRAAGLPAYTALKSRYIGYLTFALNYKLHGVNVFGYHVVNFVIHIVNAILVYFFILLTFRTPYFRGPGARDQGPGISKQGRPVPSHQSRVPNFFALAAALLFVAHPIQTEAVTYVFQRLASLVSMFYLLALVLYIKGRLATVKSEKLKVNSEKLENSRFTIIWYLLSVASAVLAMKTKENAFTLLVIITLYEFLFFSGPLKARVLRLVPFLLTMLIIPTTIMGLESTAGEIISQIKDPASLGYQELSRGDYIFTQMRVIITYIRLLFFPINQTIDYDYPIYHSLFALPVLFSFFFLLALFGAAVYLIYKSQSKKLLVRSKKDETENDGPNTDGFSLLTTHYSLFTIYCFRLIGFGILWFFITLSVESSIIPIPMVIDEYRAYLPSVGFFLALVAGVVLLLKQGSLFTIHPPRTDSPAAGASRFAKAVTAFALLAIILAATTYARNTLWQDKVSLWEDVLTKSPNSPRGYNNLGIAYNEKGMNEKAIAMYERCIELSPFQKDVHINLGIAYAMSNRIEKAIEEFTKATAITPGNGVIYENLALAYARTGRFDKAAETYTRAVELNPYNSKSYHGLGTSFMKIGRVEDALWAYTKFVSLSPNDPEAYRNRAVAYSQKGDLQSAREDFQKSCSLGSSQGCESLERIR